MKKLDVIQQSIRLLKARALTGLELAERLEKRGYSHTDIERAITECKARKWIDDAKVAEHRAMNALDKRAGRHKVHRQLDAAGVEESTRQRAIEKVYEPVDESRMARELLLARKPSFQRLDPSVAHRRAFGLLIRRGYDEEVIRAVIDEILGPMPNDSSDCFPPEHDDTHLDKVVDE